MAQPFRFQFSIRSMLGFTALVALVLGLGKWIGPYVTAVLVFDALLVMSYCLMAGCLDAEVVIGGTVGLGVVLVASALLPSSYSTSCLFAGVILGAMCGDVWRDAKLTRSLRRHSGKSILQALPFPLPERWMRRAVLIGAGVMVVVLAVLVFAGVCLLPPTAGWGRAAKVWHDCVTPVQYSPLQRYPSVYSFRHILPCTLFVWPIVGLAAFSVLASVLVHVQPRDQLRRDRCLWRVGAAHTMNGLIIALITLQRLVESLMYMSCHGYPREILDAIIWSSAYLPVNAILLVLSVSILGRNMGRYFRLCGWLLALAFATAVNAAVVAVGTALLLLW